VRESDFEQLYADHAGDLLAFLVYRTGNRVLAEDLVADTFERVLRTRVRFDPRRASRKTWIYSIALNCLRDHARRRGAEQRALEAVGVPVGGRGQEVVEDRELVMGAMDTLSASEREAIALRYGADLTMKEIAKVTGERLSTVESRVYEALRKMRERLG
jgi:RNA polymerase sigma-70 factor, ECF subfamily